MKKFLDSGQGLVLIEDEFGENTKILPWEFKEYEKECDTLPDIPKSVDYIYVCTIDERLFSDVTEDMASAWINEHWQGFHEHLSQDDCPNYVLSSLAWIEHEDYVRRGFKKGGVYA